MTELAKRAPAAGLLVLFLAFRETGHVDRQALVGGQRFGQLDQEAVGLMQIECGVTRDDE